MCFFCGTTHKPRTEPTLEQRMKKSPLQESPDGVWKLGEEVRVLQNGVRLDDGTHDFGWTPSLMTIYRISDKTIMLYDEEERFMQQVVYKTLDHTIVKKGTPIEVRDFGRVIKGRGQPIWEYART